MSHINCPSCSEQIDENADFCKFCGAKVEGNQDASATSEEKDGQNIRDRVNAIDGKDLVLSIALAFIPALGLALEFAFSVQQGSPAMFWIPWIGFTYLIYRHRPLRNKGAAVLFYLAVESFLLPVSVIASTFILVSEQEGGLQQLGAAISSGVVIILAFVVGLVAGIVLYLISNRLEIEKVEPVDVGGG